MKRGLPLFRFGSEAMRATNLFKHLLAQYQCALVTSQRMLAFAATQQCASFNQARDRFIEQIGNIRALKKQVRLTLSQHTTLADIMLELVLVDAQIRRLVDPASAQLDRMLGASIPVRQRASPDGAHRPSRWQS